jgi:hypothetical protein
MNLIINKFNISLNRFANIFINIISLNKLPLKGSLTYLLLLLIGIISSLIIRYNHFNILILDYPEYIIYSIRVVSILYSLFLFFNYLIITAHAFKLMNFFNEHKERDMNLTNNSNIIFIGYYLYYFYITFVTSFVVVINYCSFLKMGILHIYSYFFLIFIIFILATYFIYYKIEFIYNINKQLTFTGKIILFSMFTLFFIYLYSIYTGTIIKFIQHLSPFKTIYCESTSAQVENDLNNLRSNSVVNSNNTDSTNVNGNNNSNIGNRQIQPSNTNTNTSNEQQSFTNVTATRIQTETRTVNFLTNNSDDNLPFLDSRSSTPTPFESEIRSNTPVPFNQEIKYINNKKSLSKFPNMKFDLITNDLGKYKKKILDNILNFWYHPNSIGYYLGDSFYDNLNNNADYRDREILESIQSKSFSTVLSEIKSLYNHHVITNNDSIKYIIMLINASLDQSSEYKVFFNDVKNSINSPNFNIFLYLDVVLNRKLIYLNGTYSFFKNIYDDGEFKDINIVITGTNKASFINTLFDLHFTYDKISILTPEIKLKKIVVDNLLKEQTTLFKEKYGFDFSNKLIDKALDENIKTQTFGDYINKIDDLVFQNIFGVFRIRYKFDGKEIETIINCDSLFKLRYFIFNRQTTLIYNYKRLCNFNNWIIEKDNKIINNDIWNLITKLDKNFNNLLTDKSTIPAISPKVWEDFINNLTAKYNMEDIYNGYNKLPNVSESNYPLIRNRIIRNELLNILKSHQLNIDLQSRMKITGLDDTLIENNNDNLFLKS